jgi:HAE1 family hydrophobic/amphiphilic exporter-1
LLSQTQSTYNAFFFVGFKPWDQRKSAEQRFVGLQANLARALGGVKQGIAFTFPPPAIPGLGSSGGVSIVLEDRSGGAIRRSLRATWLSFWARLRSFRRLR